MMDGLDVVSRKSGTRALRDTKEGDGHSVIETRHAGAQSSSHGSEYKTKYATQSGRGATTRFLPCHAAVLYC